MFLPFILYGLIDISLRTQWDNLEQVNISELPESGTVRLEGIIAGEPEEVAISGFDKEGRYGYVWKWNNDDIFILNDSTSSVKISTEKFYWIEPGPHPAPNAEETKGTVYITGDNVVIIGEVIEKDGNKFVYLKWISPKDPDITIPLDSYFLGYGFLIPFIIWLIILVIFSIKRNILHNSKVQYKNPILIKKGTPKKILGLEWKKNIIMGRKKHVIIVSIIILIASIIILQTIFNYEHIFNRFIILALIDGIVGPIFIVFPVMTLFDEYEPKPVEIATSEKGVHFYYNNNVFVYLKTDFIGWDEIKNIYLQESKDDRSWIIQKNDESSVKIDNINKKNRDHIIAKWKEWKEKK
jgi:hypothetical protein